MRFILRPGSDPTARADATLLRALGLPGGGIVRIGSTHCRVSPGDVPSPTALLVGPRTLANAGVGVGDAIEVTRVLLSEASRVTVTGAPTGLDSRHLSRALQGRPVTVGDTVWIDPSYAEEGAPSAEDSPEPLALTVTAVDPAPAAYIGSGTVVHDGRVGGTGPTPPDPPPTPSSPSGPPPDDSVPSAATALLAGLDDELETLTGWLSLLTSDQDLPEIWGLPAVAGVLLEGPAGCGKSELVAAAAERAGATVREISLDLVFKPEKLLERLETAVRTCAAPCVLFVDRLDAVAGDEAMFRTQVAAILRWFVDAVAERPRIACVLGTSDVSRLPESVTRSALVPRTLSIPPPDARRRALLFEAALARVPTDRLDYAALAGRTAGFSGADVVAAVVHASAMIASHGGRVTQDDLQRAVDETSGSLGTTGLGEMPASGFDRVANLVDVKQRLTESVVWQMHEPERFARLGIEPPRGLLLYGPPGTGKTFVIRALAHEAGAAFFTVKGAELLDKFVGESERAVREVFARARAVAPAILFFDEIDALAPVRGNSNNAVTDSVVAALLTEMDGVTERGMVFVIGATNRRDLVDPALLRAGRLETHLYLGLPERESRAAFFAMADVPFVDVDIEAVIDATEGFSFADLTGLLREAALQALRRDATAMAVSTGDIDAALAGAMQSRAGARPEPPG